MLGSYLAIFGAILEVYSHFHRPYPNSVVFFQNQNFKFFSIVCLKMDLMACPGKNNRISGVSGPNWARFGQKRTILGFRGDSQGCSSRGGIKQLKFNFFYQNQLIYSIFRGLSLLKS